MSYSFIFEQKLNIRFTFYRLEPSVSVETRGTVVYMSFSFVIVLCLRTCCQRTTVGDLRVLLL